jgi:hypothetical protein
MDEILGMGGVTDETLPDIWLGMLNEKYNVLTVHAEMEGMSKLFVFDGFLRKASVNGARFLTLRKIAESADMRASEIVAGELPGRAGTVALQKSGFSE